MERIWIDFFDINFKSVLCNLKSAILLGVLLFSLSSFAEAQQTGKIPRIGFLDPSTASGSAGLLEAFREELASLDGLRERISPSSTDLPSKTMSGCLSLRGSWFDLRLSYSWSHRHRLR